MAIKTKPIQSTPILSGIDAKKIIEQVNMIPSKQKVDRIKEKLKLRRAIAVK